MKIQYYEDMHGSIFCELSLKERSEGNNVSSELILASLIQMQLQHRCVTFFPPPQMQMVLTALAIFLSCSHISTRHCKFSPC